MNQRIKIKRGENWSPEQKNILRQLISASSGVIEDRSNKSEKHFKKSNEWQNITNAFNEVTGKKRTKMQCQLAWKRMKMSAKKNMSTNSQEQLHTGGGGKPQSLEDLTVMSKTPLDFDITVNENDEVLEAKPKVPLNPKAQKVKNVLQSRISSIDLTGESDISFQNRNIEMLEEEHRLNLQIKKLQIRKIKLEIDIREIQKAQLITK